MLTNMYFHRRAIEIIQKQFLTLVEEQDFFGSEEGNASLLATIKDESLHNEIKKVLASCSTSKEKWNKTESIIKYHRNKVCFNSFNVLRIAWKVCKSLA